MGRSLEEFYDLSWFEFDCILEGYLARQREIWTRVLFMTYSQMMGNPYIPPHNKPWSFQDYVDGVMDPESLEFTITPEEVDKVMELWGIK